MSGYIGTQPVPQATQTRDSFTATSGQTSFATGGYTPNFLDVYLNGVKLASADYTATNGSDVVLASGAATGDILEVVAYTAFDTANVTGATNFTVTGAFTSQGIDDNGNATALTIDSSENVLIGKTAQSVDTVGAEILPSGIGQFTVDGNFAGRFTRKTSDGDILVFRKGTGTVGSIGTVVGQPYFISGSRGIRIAGNNIRPTATAGANLDNVISLGDTGQRFKDLYLSGGIYLGGTGSANKLDDYEEGTFNATLLNVTSTITSSACMYTKIGNMVYVFGKIVLSSLDTSDGSSITIGSLPFSASSNGFSNGQIIREYNRTELFPASVATDVTGIHVTNANTFNINRGTGTGINPFVTYSMLNSSGEFTFGVTYTTNS